MTLVKKNMISLFNGCNFFTAYEKEFKRVGSENWKKFCSDLKLTVHGLNGAFVFSEDGGNTVCSSERLIELILNFKEIG